MRSTLLLLATDPDVLIDVANAARMAGYDITAGRYREMGIDALARVEAQVALIHVEHSAASSREFAALADRTGTRLVLFSNRPLTDEDRIRITPVSERTRTPILEYGSEAAELIQALEKTVNAG